MVSGRMIPRVAAPGPGISRVAAPGPRGYPAACPGRDHPLTASSGPPIDLPDPPVGARPGLVARSGPLPEGTPTVIPDPAWGAEYRARPP